MSWSCSTSRAPTTAATWARGCTRIRSIRTTRSAPSRWPKCCAGGWCRPRSASTIAPSGCRPSSCPGNYFSMLGVKPAIGRVFNSQEDDQVYQGHPVVVLSYDYWVSRFARDPARPRQEDSRQRLADDDRRRVRGGVCRHRPGPVAADQRADTDEAGDDAGVELAADGRSARALGSGVRTAEAGLHGRIGGGAAAGPVHPDPDLRDDAAGGQGLVGVLARSVHEGPAARRPARPWAIPRFATTSPRRSSC